MPPSLSRRPLQFARNADALHYLPRVVPAIIAPRAPKSRYQSSSHPPPAAQRRNSTDPTTATLGPRWLSELKPRLGKCVLFGLTPPQAQSAGLLLQEMTRDWRELIVGSEGFLTGPQRRGLFRHEVVWGEMVIDLISSYLSWFFYVLLINYTCGCAAFINFFADVSACT